MSRHLTSLSIFFPAYNEEANIAKSVEKAVEVAKRLTSNYEILVVNDGSSDNTADVVQALCEQNPHVRLINHAQNQGYGGALMSGFINATKGWIFFSDADLQFDLDELDRLVEKTDTNDVVLGYRIKRNDPFMRLLNAKGWNFLNRALFGLRVKDIDCAFKLFKSETVKPILRNMQSRGAMISAELLIRLHRNGVGFAEVGVNHYPRKMGSATGAKPSVIIRAFREMARVYRGDLGSDWVKGTLRFMLVGGFNTFLDIATYLALTRSIGLFADHRMWAKGISYMVGGINSLVWNRAIGISVKKDIAFTVLPMLVIFAGALGINTVTMYVLYETLGLNEIVALLGATVGSFVWNFIISKAIK
jgi:glycosyltransferase involved in cell wall biosynthesis